MGILKPKASQATPYMPPRKAEVHGEYGALSKRSFTLHQQLSELRREHAAISDDLAATPAPRIKPAVAALLGEQVIDKRAEKQARKEQLAQEIADHESALAHLRQRIDEVNGPANLAVCEAVKPEYSRRVATLVSALEAARKAADDVADLTRRLQDDDVSWTRLGVFVPKLGFVEGLAREAREAGYVS